MSADINFLLPVNEEVLRRKKRIKTLNILAVISLLCVVAASFVLFTLIQAANPSSVKKEQEAVSQEMSQFKERQVKLFILNNRVENIDKILEARKNVSGILGSLLEKFPAGLTAENLEINEKTVLLTAKSNSLLAIGELINNLTDMVRRKDKISSLTLNSLALDKGRNVYQISIKSEL